MLIDCCSSWHFFTTTDVREPSLVPIFAVLVVFWSSEWERNDDARGFRVCRFGGTRVCGGNFGVVRGMNHVCSFPIDLSNTSAVCMLNTVRAPGHVRTPSNMTILRVPD